MITTQELIKKVRCLINETDDGATAVSLITDDIRSIDDTIKELLPQAVAIVQKQSKGKFVNVKSRVPANVVLREFTGKGISMVLPADFANLVSVKLKSWTTPCVEVSLPNSAVVLYKFGNAVASVSSRPVCVEDILANGVRVLKLFPACSTDKLHHFVYEAQFNAAEGLNRCDDRMVDAVSYVCAALLYNVFERYDAAKPFMTFASALCEESGK